MTNHEVSHATQIRNLTSAEMEQTHGGAWYAKFDGVDGSAQSRSSGTEDYSAIVFVGGWGSSMYQY